MKLHHFRQILPLLLGALLLTTTLSWADYPRPYQMREVRHLAYQLRQDASVLEQAAFDSRRYLGRRGPRVVERMTDLSQRARDFFSMVVRYPDNPASTENAWRDLRATYDQSNFALSLLHGDEDVDRAIRNVRTEIDSLTSYYAEHADDDHGGRPGGHHLAETAFDIQRIAGFAYDRARAEVGPDRYRDTDMDEAMNRLDAVRNAARAFAAEAAQPRGERDWGEVRAAYQQLARAYRRAERRIWHFSLPVRNSFARLGDRLDQLDFLSPGFAASLRRGE